MAMKTLKKMLPVLGLAPFLFCLLPAWGENTGGGDEVLHATLENGLRVVIVRNTLAPVVTTIVNYLVGSNEAPEGFPGMAHAQEHMMFRGSPGLSANQLAGIIAVMGGRFNADTQQTVTQYFLTAPAEDLDVVLRIEAIRMRGVLDSERLWAQERGAIEQEVAQDLSNPEYVFYTRLLAHMFKGTPYAHTPLGTVPSFNQTTGAMLKEFYDRWYAPNNALLVIVGDVQTRKALAEVKKLFGGIPARKIPERPVIRLEPVTAETFPLKTDLSYGLLMLSFRFPGYESEDYPATRVLADVLSSQRGNLFALVPEGKALYTGFTLSTLPKAGLGYAVAAFPKGGDPSSLEKEVRKILEQGRRKGFPAGLVEAAKRNQITRAELKKNSVFGLAMAWSQALAVEGRSSPEEGVKALQKVRVSDVNRVARKYLDPDHAVVAILTPEPSGKPVPTKARRAVESFTPKQTGPVRLPGWAEKSLSRLSVPVSRVNPVVKVLPNGLRLMVQPESVSNTVSVYGHVKNTPDLEASRGKEGVDQVLDQLFSFGTTSLDRLAFQKALDDIGARASAGTDFYVQVMAGEFDAGVRLLADNVLRPALPEEAFKTVQRQVAATVAGLLESPEYLAGRALKAALLPADDPTLREATPATVSSLTLQEVKDYYRRVFRPDLTCIVVIGKVTPEEAQAVMERHFGSWTAVGPKPETLLPPVPPNRTSNTAVPDQSRVQDKVMLVETLGLTRASPDYYALELGNHVLGGAFYATRLYQGLREKSGLVYYVESSFDVGQTRAIYAVNFACDPQNVSRARKIVEENLKIMQTTPVTPQELQQAKALLLRKIPLSEASEDSIAGGLIYRAQHDLPLNEPIRAAHRYLELTAEQVRSAFAKWLRPYDLVQVSQGPAPE
ncbi:MAG: M16 family metallopeptidase [Planctomycetaceae bacterium]